MSGATLPTENRDLTISRGELNKQRKAGKVPAVVFGKEIGSIPVFVDLLTFKNIHASQGKIFEIKVGDKVHVVNTKKVEMNALGNRVDHINFHQLKAGQSTTVSIPITLMGEAKGAKDGGLVTTVLDVLPITGLPKDMPEKLEIDITELDIGETIDVCDVKLLGKFTIELPPATTVVSCAASKVQEEEPTVVEAAEGAEAAPAAEGAEAAPAADAAAEKKED